jgi:dihydroorotate dehydrogenase electron transfer subunit
MLKKHNIAKVTENIPIAKDIYRMALKVDAGALDYFRPGQFLHIKIPSGELLLRRPISINDYDCAKSEIRIAYLVTGEGTKRLVKVRAGEELDILFPLGNGFKLEDSHKKVLLIGGGIGIAPLLSVMTYYPGRQYTALLGYRCKDMVYELEEFEKRAKVYVTTDDGSLGQKGFATDLLEEQLKTDTPDVILACGPHCFFGSLKKITSRYTIPAYASLEQRMGCGTGGCSVCVCNIAGENRRICVEGPVFDLSEVEV